MFTWKKKQLSILNFQNNYYSALNIQNLLHCYQKNPIVFQCINYIINTICANSLLPYKNIFSQTDLQNLIASLMISGNGFIKIEAINQENKITVLNFTQIEINDKNEILFQKKIDKNIIQLKLNNDFSNGPMHAAYSSINTHNKLLHYIEEVIQNGCRPSGILSFNNPDSINHKEDIQEEIHKLYQTMNNNGAVAIINGNFTWTPIGLSLEKLQICELELLLAKQIVMCFNVSLTLIGKEQATYANYREENIRFVDNIAKPTINYIADKLFQISQQKLLEFQSTKIDCSSL